MQKDSKVVAIILAGGSGVRFGGSVPKQLLLIEGKPVIAYTIEAFENNAGIDEIAIVSNPKYIEDVFRIVESYGFRKVRKVIPGGKERYLSSLNAIKEYEDNDWLVFHDAVRPLVSQRIINDCVIARQHFDAIDVAVKTTDTIIQVHENSICGIPPRPTLWNGQSPQCFRCSVIKSAYEIALNDPNFATTDDCGVVFKYLPHIPVHIIEGDPANIKLTYGEDLHLVSELFRRNKANQSHGM